jgi:hypothetical protein
MPSIIIVPRHSYKAIANAAPAAAIKPPMPTFNPDAAPVALLDVAAPAPEDVADGAELEVPELVVLRRHHVSPCFLRNPVE